MAKLYFGVWDNANEVLFGEPIQEGAIDIGSGSLKSPVISGDRKEMRRVRLLADTDCFVTWGVDPTALDDGTAGRPLGADNPEIVGIAAGKFIAVIERVL